MHRTAGAHCQLPDPVLNLDFDPNTSNLHPSQRYRGLSALERPACVDHDLGARASSDVDAAAAGYVHGCLLDRPHADTTDAGRTCSAGRLDQGSRCICRPLDVTALRSLSRIVGPDAVMLSG